MGQVHRTYLVCEAPGELVLVDQHAAHERVAFSRLRRAHRARAVARQQLLFPLEIELDEAAAATAARPEAAQVLAGLGFEWDAFGERRLVLRAVPELLKDADPRGLLLDALGGLGDDPAALAADEAVDHLLATLACHSVKRAGDVMTARRGRGAAGLAGRRRSARTLPARPPGAGAPDADRAGTPFRPCLIRRLHRAAAPRVVAILGPTASGKSALALALAARLPVEILCCDSMQVYRGLDIGTAKPTAAEQAAVPHHLLDLVEPGRAVSRRPLGGAAPGRPSPRSPRAAGCR